MAISKISQAFRDDFDFLLNFYSRLIVMAINGGASPEKAQSHVANFIKQVFDLDVNDESRKTQAGNTIENIQSHPAIVTIAKAMLDREYSWGWFCNLAMLACDAGGDRIRSSEAARELMKQLFNIDVAEQWAERWPDQIKQ